MYLGEVSKTQLLSVALMIIFTMAAMFFIGYKFSYDKAIRYANIKIEEEVGELREQYNVNQDFILGNISIPKFEDKK